MQEASSERSKKREEELKALSSVLAVLDGLSNSQVRSVLTMAAAQHNMRVVAANAPVAVQQMRTPPSAQQKGKRKGSAPQAKPENRAPEVRLLKSELKLVQDRIRQANSQGESLSDSDPLIQERNNLLARIVQAKSSFRRSETEGESEQKSSAETQQEDSGSST